ncbi:MAG: F0F1 ATP synthase subunit A [Bdellovibrionales bacterium]|nr:F0F1 ATP synthase subunit A [Bdellovibrionales bacterium]
MNHFNWLQLIESVGHHYIHIATALLVTGILFAFAFAARLQLATAQKSNFAPADKFSIRGVAELFTEVVINLSDMVLGPENRRYVPLFGSIFLYVLFNNIMGMIPGMTPATDNVNTTVAVGIFSFLTYNYFGLRAGGLTYLKHFLGPVIWLAWLMLPLEIVSHLVRPMSLGLRLMGNMQGDHTVIGIFLDLAPWGVPIIFYGLGLFVSVVQSFVFTLLSMVYLSMAVAHDEH